MGQRTTNVFLDQTTGVRRLSGATRSADKNVPSACPFGRGHLAKLKRNAGAILKGTSGDWGTQTRRDVGEIETAATGNSHFLR